MQATNNNNNNNLLLGSSITKSGLHRGKKLNPGLNGI